MASRARSRPGGQTATRHPGGAVATTARHATRHHRAAQMLPPPPGVSVATAGPAAQWSPPPRRAVGRHRSTGPAAGAAASADGGCRHCLAAARSSVVSGGPPVWWRGTSGVRRGPGTGSLSRARWRPRARASPPDPGVDRGPGSLPVSSTSKHGCWCYDGGQAAGTGIVVDQQRRGCSPNNHVVAGRHQDRGHRHRATARPTPLPWSGYDPQPWTFRGAARCRARSGLTTAKYRELVPRVAVGDGESSGMGNGRRHGRGGPECGARGRPPLWTSPSRRRTRTGPTRSSSAG